MKIFSIFLDTRSFFEHFLKKCFFALRKAENKNEVKAAKGNVLAAPCNVLAKPHCVSAALHCLSATQHGVSAAPQRMLAALDMGIPGGLEGSFGGGYYT